MVKWNLLILKRREICGLYFISGVYFDIRLNVKHRETNNERKWTNLNRKAFTDLKQEIDLQHYYYTVLNNQQPPPPPHPEKKMIKIKIYFLNTLWNYLI